MTDDDSRAAISVVGLKKRYPGTLAVDLDPDQRLDFLSGEIHALVGENGAGKSTLVSMIAGITSPSDGTILLNAMPYAPGDVVEARRSGIDIVLQEPGLVDTMSVEENLLLGRETDYAPHWFFTPRARRRVAESTLRHIRRSIPMSVAAGSLSLEDQKFVELARALSMGPRVLIIDEMTASLSERGVPELFEILRSFAASGGCVIYISHYLEEVAALCDRVTVMRDGRHVRTMDAGTASVDELSLLMVGRSVMERMYRADWEARVRGAVVFEARDLTLEGRFTGVSLTLHEGEVLGIGGLIGCGSETLALALFGDVHPTAGATFLRGRPVRYRGPSEAIASGLGLVPGDREREGLVLNMSVQRNIALPVLPWLNRWGFVRPGVESGIAAGLMKDLRIVAKGPADLPMTMSGGNRQKVVLSKWLARDVTVLILHNPTRGVDVGGRAEMYMAIRALADRGVGVLLISDDLAELIGLSDTLKIMRRGRVSATVLRDERPTEETLIGYML